MGWRVLMLFAFSACVQGDPAELPECADSELLILYQDRDGDGFGDVTQVIQTCEFVSGYVYSSEDCDDDDVFTHPGASERCDDKDNNCDGIGDTLQTLYPDQDGDGYGGSGEAISGCAGTEGYSTSQDDCDDSSPMIAPNAIDDCDGVDNDCDGLVDEDSKTDWTLLSLDHTAGAVWEIVPSAGSFYLHSLMAFGGAQIVTTDSSEDGYALAFDTVGEALYEVDVCSPHLQALAPGTAAGMTCGLAFGSGQDVFGLDPLNDQLVKFDVMTGSPSSVGPLGFDLGDCGLAYDCSNDRLIGVDVETDTLFVVDARTGESSEFIETTLDFESTGLAFEAKSGMLWATAGGALHEVDPVSGLSIPVMEFPAGVSMDDLAFFPPCP